MKADHQNPTRRELSRQFSDRLNQWLQFQGIPPEDRPHHLASHAEIDKPAARRYLNGQMPRDYSRLVKICKAIDAPIDALMCDRQQCSFLWLCSRLTPAQHDQFGRLLMRLNNGSRKAARALEMAAAGQIRFEQALKIAGG